MLALIMIAAAQLYLGTVEAVDGYGAPLRVVVRESALPGVECGLPWAGACSSRQGDVCTLYLPSAEAEAWTTLYTGLGPDQVAGHELAHCWRGHWHV